MLLHSSKIIYLLTSTVLLLLQLLFLYFIKYFNQDLSISEFSLNNIGNIFAAVLYLAIIMGIYRVFRKRKIENPGKDIFSFVIISWLLLIVSFISTKVRIIPTGVYLLNQQGDKVLTGLSHLLYLMTLFYFLISIWFRILKRKKISFLKNILSTILLLLLLLLLVLIYSWDKDLTTREWKSYKNKNSVAVVLGAAVWSGNIPSPTLSLRVEKAMELLKKGIVEKIVFTGGSAPGELAESEVAYEYAKVKGLDTAKVLIEKSTSSTTEQIKWIKKNLVVNNKVNVILVSDGYHLPRAIEISKFFNLKVQAVKSDHKLSLNDKILTMIRESIALFIFWNFAL